MILNKFSFKQLIANWFYKFFIYTKKLDKSKNVYIYDIDNTVAKTHEFSSFSGVLDKNNVVMLDYYRNMTKKIILNYKNNDLVYFFSVRPINLWIDTLKWLKNIGIDVKPNELFFFQSPKHKVNFIKYLCDKGYKIFFYDDMSYNHENNKVLFYQNEIDILKKMPIEFFDYNFLKNYNK